MKLPPRFGVVHVLVALSSSAFAQNFLPLDFSQNVQPNNGIYPNMSTLGPEYYSGTSFDFVNVTTQNGQSIDARVTILGSQGAYEFVGWIPDYNSAAGQPDGDLGVYYRHTGSFAQPTGGIAYLMTFYVGGGTFTNQAVLSDFRLLIYDHDGEPGQSESIRAYLGNGLTGYQIRNGSNISASLADGMVAFDAGGQNLSETGPEGSFIAYYSNTSQVRFDMYGTTLPSNPAGNNGMFAAFDGDLSLTGGQTSGFGSFVAVPEPTSSTLIAAAISAGLLRRGRSRA